MALEMFANTARTSAAPHQSPAAEHLRAEGASEAARRHSAKHTSFISLLKTKEQFAFYTRFTVGRNGGPSVADSVANSVAQKFGDIGRAGLASGAVEDAAMEAVAQLAVAPPKGFDPTHQRASGFVARHVRLAVLDCLRAEYPDVGDGSGVRGGRPRKDRPTDPRQYEAGVRRQMRGGRRAFGGSIPAGPDGEPVEVAGREADPAAPVDHAAELTRAQAREVEKAQRLQRVMELLPANALAAKRDDRFATLRAIGLSYRDASLGAAEDRYYALLAEHVRARLAVNRSAEPVSRVAPPRLEPTADEVPPRIRQRFAAPPQKTAAQREAERFLTTWYRCSTVDGVARALNRPVRSVQNYVRRLRALGISDIKQLPTSAGPLVRGALSLAPSAN